MADRRTQIEQALEKLIRRQRALDFQWLVFHLAKNRWPDLGANEWFSDGGEDGLTIPSVESDGLKRSLACSLTGTLIKVREDCKRIAGRNEEINILIFATPTKVTGITISDWCEKIRQEFNHDLIVLPKAYIVAELERPDNTWLCKNYLDLDFTDEPDIKILKEKVRKAALRNLENWKTEYRYNDAYQIELTLKLEVKPNHQKYEFINIPKILNLMPRCKQFILKGSPGTGKTITLLQIASYLLSSKRHLIPIFISLSEWSINALDIFSFIANDLTFKAENVTANDLTTLNKAGVLTFLLNGWNEIPHDNILQLNHLLKNIIRNSPATSLIIATRETEITPPVTNPDILFIEPLETSQRREIIKKHNLEEANTLIKLVENEPDLDKITRTPLFLFSIIEISKKNGVIPTSRYGILREFINNAEAEHSVSLKTGPTEGFYDHYLSWLATSFVKHGTTSSNEDEAQKIIAECSDLLVSNKLIGNIPNAKTVLNLLIEHHILIRSHDLSLVRFVHQQFQEWYAANYLYEQLTSIHNNKLDEAIFQFQKEFLNKPVWEEPLMFLAERFAIEGEDVVGMASDLIRWTMPVDLILAAKLVRLAGTDVWTSVKHEISMVLRKWYNYPDKQHKECALAAMFATTSSEFSDIILPLIENEDDQIRLSTYDIWEPFPLSCLGQSWRNRILNWPENRRVELIFEIGWDAELSNLNLITEFAEKDNSLSVHVAALQMLAQNGAFEILKKMLKDIDWSIDQYSALLDWLPKYILLEFAPQIRAAIPDIKNTKTRLGIILKLAETKDIDTVELLKEEIERNSIESKTIIKRCLPRIVVSSQKWVQDWLGNKLLEGKLWQELHSERFTSGFNEEQLNKYLENADLDLLTKLSKQVFNQKIELEVFRKRISIFSKINQDFAATVLLKEYLNINIEIQKDSTDKKNRDKESIIYAAIRELPFFSKVNAVLNYPNLNSTYENVRNILRFLYQDVGSSDNSIESLSFRARNRLRKKIFEWDKLNLTSPVDHGQLKAYLAEILGVIGNLNDVKIIEQWIKDDKERTEKESTEWKKRHDEWEKNRQAVGFPPGVFLKHIWSRQYVNAITQIKSQESFNLLLRLLYDPDYIGQATYALVKIISPDQDNRTNTFLFKPDYKNILQKRKNREVEKSNNQNDQIYKISNEIEKAINALVDKKENDVTPEFSLHEISLAAIEFAHIGGENVISTILRLAKFEECRWDVPRALDNLILNGIELPGDETLKEIEPIINKFENDYLRNHQDGLSNITRCIRVLLFTDNPALGVERFNHLLSKCLITYEIRETIEAMGYCRARVVVDFLIELKNKPESLKFCYREWISALANYSNPKIRKIFSSLLDRFISEDNIEGFRRSEIEHILVDAITKLAKIDNTFWNEIKNRCKSSKSDNERKLLANVLDKLENIEYVRSSIYLIRDDANIPIPHMIFNILENNVTTKIYAGRSNAYYREPKSNNELRELLFDLVMNDTSRKKSALTLLLFIETIRIEIGKPPDELRHPRIDILSDFNKPWPMILN